MRHQRILAFYTALCLLANIFVLPGSPVLVCRLTGQRMAPVLVKAATSSGKPPCCQIALSARSEATPHYTLVAPGCCDLHQAIERGLLSARTISSPEIPVATLTAAPLTLPIPRAVPATLCPTSPREAAPRAPPSLSSASPRAPPALS